MNRQTEIFSLRKSKVGLASVMIALMWCGTGVGAVAKADETAIMSTEIEAKVTETPLAIEEELVEDSDRKTEKEEATEVEVKPTDASLPDSEKKAKESILKIDPVHAGDKQISGQTIPGGYVFISVDGEAITSIDNSLEADEEGKFKHSLEKPLGYNQVVEISSFPKESEEESEGEGEGEELIETVKTERHPDAYKIPTERLEKTEDGQHQVLVEPILEHANKVIGHTSVKGFVYLSINGSFVSDKTSINEDGRFEVTFSDSLAGSKFKANDKLVLSFISEDNRPVITNHIVIPWEKTDSPSQIMVKPLSSDNSVLEGQTVPFGQVQLYNVATFEFLEEAIADKTGNFKVTLPKLQPGAQYYRLVYNQQGEVESIYIDTVDGPSKQLDKAVIAPLVTYLQEVDMDEATFENPIVVPTLHNKKDYIVGRTLFPHAYVRMVSSIEGKVYPPVQVDELGFFGFQIQDLQLPFEKGEKIRFEILDPKTNILLASKEVVVGQYLEDEDESDLPFQVDEVTTDHGYISGKIAPGVTVELVSTHKAEEMLARTTADATGQFVFDLGNRVLKEGETLSFRAFDQDGSQMAWEVVTVQKGKGKRISKPAPLIRKNDAITDEVKTNDMKKPNSSQSPSMSLSRENQQMGQQMDVVQEKVSLESKGHQEKMGTKEEKVAPSKKSEVMEEDKQRKEDFHAVVKQSQSVSLPKTGEKNGMLLAILGAVSLFFTVLIMSILKKRND
ncbi:YSIRK-type signal peptide-containing protein [Streptococcus suis]|uniref:YSIRK-type signal peptide-containing protein n=1 Tax=Streptococcus suis TaxID=1307 RepID=UPI003756E338